jgi:hypothetical protein
MAGSTPTSLHQEADLEVLLCSTNVSCHRSQGTYAAGHKRVFATVRFKRL